MANELDMPAPLICMSVLTAQSVLRRFRSVGTSDGDGKGVGGLGVAELTLEGDIEGLASDVTFKSFNVFDMFD